MKKGPVISAVAATLLLSYSCDESFSPKTKFEERPILYCIVHGSDISTSAEAVLARAYDVEGFDPSLSNEYHTISGAKISLSVNGRVWDLIENRPFLKKEGNVPLSATNQSQPPLIAGQRFYYLRDLSALPGDTLSIVAKLPSGEILTANTRIPRHKPLESSPRFPHGVTTNVNRAAWGNSWILDWDDYFNEGHLFFPRLSLSYTRKENGVDVYHSKEIPLHYVQRDNGSLAIYPSGMTDKVCAYELAAIDSAMAQISAGDPDKESYTIRSIGFGILEYDFPLSRYYSSVSGYLDQFSVRLDETVFSNVNGGIGVFGSTLVTSFQFEVDKQYVQSFGYRP
jgi:hypothetical protein